MKTALSILWMILSLAACVTAAGDRAASELAVCDGPGGPAPQSPFDDPERCEARPILVNGQLTTNDPRAMWCEYGACGRSSEATCRSLGAEFVEQTFVECGTGAVKCQRCDFERVECGTTAGCLEHDACYDERFRLNEAGSSSLWWALRGFCDLPIAADYPAAEWSAWMNGRPGPSGFSSWLPYQEQLGCTVTAGACD